MQKQGAFHEDGNGEKLAVKKWWLFGRRFFSRFGADFFTVYADFSRFIRDANGEKKNISLLMIFFTAIVFHGLPPLEFWVRNTVNFTVFNLA